jgi:hypothetical protein
LRSHPRISSPTGESHFIIPLSRKAAAFGDLNNADNIRNVLEAMRRINRNFVETDFHGMKFDVEILSRDFLQQRRNTIPGIISGLFEKNARGEGKARWLDKTPYYIFHMESISEMFPGAKFIHIIRDGRDCALSMFARRHDFFVYNTYMAAKYWQEYIERGQKTGSSLGRDIYFELRYEDMLTDPHGIMKKVCDFLYEDYTDSLIDFEKSRDPKTKTPLLRKPIQAGNAEKWRLLMRPRQVRIFESAAGDTLRSNGYPLLTNGKSLPLLLRATYRMHNKITVRYNRNRRNSSIKRLN